MDSSVLAIRDVLLSPSHLPGFDAGDSGEPTPLPDLYRAVATGWRQYWTGKFTELAASLPGMIGEARHALQVSGPPASAALAQSYQLAACLLTQMGKDDLAALSAERAIQAATMGDDELQWATLHHAGGHAIGPCPRHAGEPAKALKAARGVRHEDLQRISRGAHLIDVAQALTDARRRRDAVATLVQARQASPTWFRHQVLARSIVTELVEAKQQLSPALRGLARELRIG